MLECTCETVCYQESPLNMDVWKLHLLLPSDPVIQFFLDSFSGSRRPSWLLFPSPPAKCVFKLFREMVRNIQTSGHQNTLSQTPYV